MTQATLSLFISSIQIGERKRPLRQERVASLARSIDEVGQLQPIAVEQVGATYYLVFGLHRIEACKLLGRREILATIVDLDDLGRELAEIDENLERSGLTDMEEAEHLRRRQQIYEMLHPETRAGAAQAAGMNRSLGHNVTDKLSATLSFTDDTAAKTNQSARNIRRKLKRAKDIPQDVRDSIRETAIADNGSELDALAKMEPEEQRRVASLVVEGKAKSIKQASKKLRNQAKREAAQQLKHTDPTVYNVILADPPWEYGNVGVNGAASNHYPTMPTDELCAFLDESNIQIADDAILFMWGTAPLLEDAMRVLKAWDFNYKTQGIWHKIRKQPGTGWYIRIDHEFFLVATRGSMLPTADPIPIVSSVIAAPTNEHSRKPVELHEAIEALYPGTNRIELFARSRRDGWTAYGNEVDKFEEAA